jgi:hypothetical protein
VDLQAPLLAHSTSDGDCLRRRPGSALTNDHTSRTILFATIIYIGSLDGSSGLSVFGKYTSPGAAGDRRWPPVKQPGGDDGQATSS